MKVIHEKLNFSQPGTSQERKQDMKGKDMHLLMMKTLWENISSQTWEFSLEPELTLALPFSKLTENLEGKNCTKILSSNNLRGKLTSNNM